MTTPGQRAKTGNQYYPLSEHREFSVIEYSGYREYKIEDPDISGKKADTLVAWFATYACLLSFVYYNLPDYLSPYNYPMFCLFILTVLWSHSSRVLYESVILLPPHGIQLETHRGFPGMRPVFSQRRFIPATKLNEVVINEGLKGWNVLYYLAVIKSTEVPNRAIEVAFKEHLPSIDVLLTVLEGVHELFYGIYPPIPS